MATIDVLSDESRHQLSSKFSKTHDETNSLLKIVEVLVWGGAGLVVSWVWCLLFGAVALFIVSKRPELITMRLIAKLMKRHGLVMSATIIISFCYAITAASLTIVLLHGYVLIQKKALNENSALIAAQRKIQETQSQLETFQKQGSHISQSQMDMATIDEGKLQAELKQARVVARRQFEHARKAWKTNVSQFWARPHRSGISYREVMHDDCGPKLSPYGGGRMKTAAKEICPAWQTLQTNEPTLNSDPRVQQIQQQISALTPMLSHRDKLKALSQLLTQTLQNEANLRQQLQGGVNYNNGLELFISVLQKLSRHINTELFVFILVGGVVVILLGITALSRMMADVVNYDANIHSDVVGSKRPLSQVFDVLKRTIYQTPDTPISLLTVTSVANESTQSEDILPQTSINTKSTQSVKVVKRRSKDYDGLSSVIEQVQEDLRQGKLKSLAYKTLAKYYKLKQDDITKLRDMLVDTGAAVRDDTGKLVIVPART